MESLDLTEECLHTELASVTGSSGDWKEIGLMQFFAESLTIENPLNAPVSQKAVAVNLGGVNKWKCVAATKESIDKGEDSWANMQTEEEFTLNNSMKKLYDIRPAVIQSMVFAQFLTQYRLINDKSGRELRSLNKLLDSNDIGPLCNKTLIAGTSLKAPKFMRFRNSAVVKLREKKPERSYYSENRQSANFSSSGHPVRPPNEVTQ